MGLRSNATKWGRAAVIAALPLIACGAKHDRRDKVVARAWSEELYHSDLRAVVPLDASKEDSAALAQRFIDNWVRERVVLHKAEENLSDLQKNVDQQLAAYRHSLIASAGKDLGSRLGSQGLACSSNSLI